MPSKDATNASHNQDFGLDVEKIADDTQFNRNKALQEHDRDILKNLIGRDTEYLRILSSYQEYTNKILKANPTRQWWFFWISLLILVASFIIFAAVVCRAVFSDDPNIVAVLTAAVEALASFLIFPKIIAEYLFNTNENTNIEDVVDAIRQYDIRLSEDVRNMLQSRKGDVK